ncbi:hypothetical protein [Candidatus Electronema sp. TJ]|uniref:hypothetical protein n=1 Tax=Candidatus Electronema sp. TJ TaxID=3401573 RepID=UPI003AA94D2D
MNSTEQNNEDIKAICQFLIDNYETLEEDSGGMLRLDLPSFDLYSWDYLRFAEESIEKHDDGNLVEKLNCVSHLKRALDCAVAIFLDGLNLRQVFDKRNLKIEKRLEFLREIGVFTARSLSRLNSIRNRMEHDFEVPKIKELDAYFDIVSTSIALLDATLANIAANAEKSYVVPNVSDNDKWEYSVEYEYCIEAPSIRFSIEKWIRKNEIAQQEYEFTLADPKSFTKALKLLLILSRKDWMLGKNFTLKQIQEMAAA